MSVSIIGAGNVGRALAMAFTQKGTDVVIGVPNPKKYADTIKPLGNHARLTTVTDAIEASDIVMLAIPYGATVPVVSSVNDWHNKILVDVSNPIAGALEGLSVGVTTSGAEEIATHARNARVVKAFNTTGAENMADSRYPNGQIFMPVCGDDSEAKQRVIALATLIGFNAVDMGELKVARYLEPFAMTWIHLAIKQGYGRKFAFSLLTRD